MESEYIKIVTESDFEYEVIAYSNQNLVLVDFWAEWCRPCKSLTPILENIVAEAKGSIRLAKVNVDDNPNLALRFSVRSIPNVKAFRDGQVISEFLGLQPEPRIREFIRKLSPSQIDLLLDKGQSYLEAMDWREAYNSYRQFLTKSPGNSAGLLGILKAAIMLGNFEESQRINDGFPPSAEYSSLQLIQPLLEELRKANSNQEISDDPLDAAYRNIMLLIMRGNLPAAMDGLIDILRQDKHYRNDLARKVILGLFEVLGSDHPLSRQYRQELALVLF